MKQSITFFIVFLLLFSAMAFAQDADDPGAPDSLIFGRVDVEYSPGEDVYVDVPVYFVTDDSIASVMIPVSYSGADNNITLNSATWNGVFLQWEDTYINSDFTWYVGFNDIGGAENEPLLFTNGQRLTGLNLRFRIAANAADQTVTIEIGEGPHGLPLNFGLMTADADEDITPIVGPGYIYYGTVGIADDQNNLPTEFKLGQNYPNPFNPETNIEYQLPIPGFVNLAIYNLLGQNVRTLVSAYQEAGFYSAHWNGANESGQKVPSGIYFYHVMVGDFSQTKKMMMLK